MRIAFSTAGVVKHEDYRGGDMLGTEYQVFNLSKEFVKRGHEVYIVRRWYGDQKEEEIEGIRVINVGSPYLLDSKIAGAATKVLFSRNALKIINEIKPDVLNLLSTYSAAIVCKAMFPKVHFAFNNPVEITPARALLSRISTKMIKKMEERIASNVDVVVVRNTRYQNYWESKGFKTELIPVGVNIGNSESNSPDGNFVFYAGRLSLEKRLEDLLKAYSKLPSTLHERYQLIIGGEGPIKGKLNRLAEKLNIGKNYRNIPWLSNTEFRGKLGECTIFVLPSLHEGMPVTLLEAMSLGKPVIASDIPGSNDVITHGKDGFLFEKANVPKLTEYLGQLLQNPELRREIGENARRTVEAEYTFEKVADKYLKLYSRLINRVDE